MRLRVRVTPRSSRDAIEGFDGEGVLRVRVRAAPVDGAANDEVTRLLAKRLGLAQNQVQLVSGMTARMKMFDVPMEEDEVRSALLSPGG